MYTFIDTLMPFALAFLQASLTCVAAAAVLAGVLALVRLRWPGVASQRLVWLLALATVAGAFVLALWPAPAGLRMLPSIEIARPAAVVADTLPDAVVFGADDGGLTLDAVPAPGWLLALSAVWLLCYGTGLGLALLRWSRAHAALQGLLATAMPLDARALASHPGFREAAGPAPAVLESAAPVSPMLAGLVRPVLLLPRHLRTFDPGQQQLIVAHELAHWQRRDHWWLHASLLLQTVFWFNPALKALAAGLSHAQELGCDRQVLACRPVAVRRDYAAALVAQLKVQQGATMALSAPFGGAGAAALAERIGQLRLPDLGGATRLASAGKAALVLCCAAVIGAALLLQPAFAWRAPALSVAAGTAAASTLPVWQAPLSRIKVNSPYGERPGKPTPQASPFHRGVDLSARRGTPLLAPADGIVSESTDLYQGQAKFGKVIVIDHGGGLRSMYAHLDQRTVSAGDAVTAGQAIGKTGNTGKTTGPHLHVEVSQDGRHIDPQRLIAALRAP
ncbi:peptidoglycan DD-metalloendopeptidase family protein [Duganella sp. FT92W]|uniref:Peptidoglycan DD-metalloendopeptidase family protein n=1 Tax=Pseudoduganella rivuli TaxID=2666085 RepID=A0A7X2LWN8_9BURK|nr:M23/M56 family metallopeptidase [Pseudoduganella rivuli]MRV76188.1 peptidoglycan DD-metalloendopeptidase family protein [Pseudoduganella rivuli]